MSLRQRDDSGTVAILAAACALVLLGTGALVVDIGSLYATRRQSQRTADLAALAGAQDLPSSSTKACQDAVDYLNRNAPGGVSYGADGSLCTPLGLADGTVTISADYLTLRVKVPDQRVNFGLAGALGYNKGYTAASATVEVRSPGVGTLPFGLSSSAASAGGEQCLKFGSGSSSNPLCLGSATGNFAYVDLPRIIKTQNTKSLDYNLKYGADHGFAIFPAAPANTQCANSSGGQPIVGAIPDISPPYPDTALPNCLPTQTGNNTAAIQNGLIDGTFDSATPDRGRLAFNTPLPTDHVLAQIAGRINVDNDRYASFVNSDGSIKPSIVDDPRFGIVPYFNVTDLGVSRGTSFYPVLGFVGVFIQEIETSRAGDPSSGSITNATAQIIPFTKLEFLAPDTGDTIKYLGGGVRIPVLVK